MAPVIHLAIGSSVRSCFPACEEERSDEREIKMNSRYHRHGHLRSALVPAWKHLSLFCRSQEYRAFQRFCRLLRHKPRYTPGAVKFSGHPIRYFDTVSFLSAWDEIFVNRIYEIPHDSDAPLLVDLGANIGLAPLFWSTIFKKFRYIGFEADPDAAAICRENLDAWGCGGQLHQCAVTGKEGEVRFLRDHADAGRVTRANDPGERIVVQSVRLSSFIREPVDLLKIDIEGAESEVLEEARDCLGLVKRVFVELHDFDGKSAGLGRSITVLEQMGFRCFAHPIQAPDYPFLSSCGRPGAQACLINVYAVR
jgi:FkbM family methyltransferase